MARGQRGLLEELRALYPGVRRAGERLHAARRRLPQARSDPAAERAALEELASRDGDAGPGLSAADGAGRGGRRLGGRGRERPSASGRQPAGPRTRTAGSPAPPSNSARRDEAIAAYRALALLDDTDPAEVHFRLARLLQQAGKPTRPAARS